MRNKHRQPKGAELLRRQKRNHHHRGARDAVLRSIPAVRHAAATAERGPPEGRGSVDHPPIRSSSHEIEVQRPAMDCLLHRLRCLRGSEPESPRYRRERGPGARGDSSSTSDTSSYYSASSNFIDRVILGKHIYIRGSGIEPEPDFSESDFVLDCLHWHNAFREKHGVPPLVLSNQLCSMAQFWANHLAHTNTFSHRNLRDIGENLFSKWSYIPDFDITGQQVTKYWYDEIKTYNFFQHPDLLHVKAGHFTQLVWRSSRDLGIGKARSRCGKVIVVAHYRPAGNVVGQFHDNVLPPLNDSDIFRDV